MKKIFTSLMLLATVAVASAQNFTVTGAGEATYADGDVINVGYTEGARPGTYLWDPELSVTVNTAGSLLSNKSTYTVTATANVPEIVQFCGLDGVCNILLDAPVSKSNSYSAGISFPLAIDIAAKREIISSAIEVKVVITDGKETVNLTVNFLPSEHQAGIETPEVADFGITINGRTLSYNVASRANLTLYNISGRAVLNSNVNGNGTLSLDNLPAGVYVYRLGETAGKILVR